MSNSNSNSGSQQPDGCSFSSSGLHRILSRVKVPLTPSLSLFLLFLLSSFKWKQFQMRDMHAWRIKLCACFAVGIASRSIGLAAADKQLAKCWMHRCFLFYYSQWIPVYATRVLFFFFICPAHVSCAYVNEKSRTNKRKAVVDAAHMLLYLSKRKLYTAQCIYPHHHTHILTNRRHTTA